MAPRRDEAAVLYDAAPGAQRVIIFSGLDTGERSAIASALSRHGMLPAPAMAVAEERHALRPLADLLSKAVRRRLREVSVTDEKRVHLAAEAARAAASKAKAKVEAETARKAAARPPGAPEDDAETAIANANAAANAAARAAAKAAKASRVPFTGWPTPAEMDAERAKARAAQADDEPDSDDEDDGSAFDRAEQERPYARAREAKRLAEEKERLDEIWRKEQGIVEDYGVPREPEPWERGEDVEGDSATLLRGGEELPEADEAEAPPAPPAPAPEAGSLASDEALARGFMEELQRSREAGADLSFLHDEAPSPDAADAEPAWFGALKAKYDMPAVWDRIKDAQLPERDPAEEAAAAAARRAAARAKQKSERSADMRMGKLDGRDDEDLLGADVRAADGPEEEVSMESALDQIRAAREAVRKQMLAAEAAKRPQQPQRRSFGPEPPSASAQ